MTKARLFSLAAVIGVAALSRVLPHPYNFTPVAAMALFGGAQISDRRFAYGIPIAAMFLSDLAIGFHGLLPLVYLCFLLTVGIGRWVSHHKSVSRIAGGAFAGSVLFFVATNLGVWAFQSLYPKTAAGLVACYLAAIPFFQTTLLGDAIWTAALFGGWAFATRYLPALRETAAATAK